MTYRIMLLVELTKSEDFEKTWGSLGSDFRES